MKKKVYIICFILISIVALSIRIPFMNEISGDMRDFILVWMQKISDNGGIKALGLEIGNYNIIYMTLLAVLTYIPINRVWLVKILSIIFDYIIAYAGAKIIEEIIKKQEKKDIIFLIAYGILLLIPTMILNSSMWGQCDSIYTAFVLLSILFLIKEKYLKSIILLGIAFAFKLQTIFIFPLYGLVYLGKRKFPFYYFFIIPIVNFISWIPALINGRTIDSCLKIYIGQTETVNNLITRNFVNIYNFIFRANSTFIENDGKAQYIGIILLLIMFIIISVIIVMKKIDINNELILLIGIWGIVISVFLLPYMHERYMFIADILSIIYAIIAKRKEWLAFCINLVSIYLYFIYLRNIYLLWIPPLLAAAILLVIATYLTGSIIYKIFGNTKKERELLE